MKSIFVASSSAYIQRREDGRPDPVASRAGKLSGLLKAIEDAGFNPVPWWEWWQTPQYRHHDSLLVNLHIFSQRSDGGIFVLGEDVEVAPQTPGDVQHVPNSNVLLEAGMFIGAKGLHNTLFVLDAEHAENLKSLTPTDLAGYLPIDLNNPSLAEHIREHFNRANEATLFDKVTFYIGTTLYQKILKKEFGHWTSKANYIGTESARIWNGLESSRGYSINRRQLTRFVEKLTKLVDFRGIDNIISLGCGNGKSDKAFLVSIAEIVPNPCYVPVDINPGLVVYAAQNLPPRARMPFAVIEDFESGSEHITKVIKARIHEIGEANFFIMLGVTFSNLDEDEAQFCWNMQGWMDEKDFFMLDVSLNASDDETYLRKLCDDGPVRELMLNSLITRGKIGNGLDASDVKFDLVEITDSPEAEKCTVIDGTRTWCYEHNGQSVLISKRYEWREISRHLSKFFEVVLSEEVPSQEGRARGIFVLKKMSTATLS